MYTAQPEDTRFPWGAARYAKPFGPRGPRQHPSWRRPGRPPLTFAKGAEPGTAEPAAAAKGGASLAAAHVNPWAMGPAEVLFKSPPPRPQMLRDAMAAAPPSAGGRWQRPAAASAPPLQASAQDWLPPVNAPRPGPRGGPRRGRSWPTASRRRRCRRRRCPAPPLPATAQAHGSALRPGGSGGQPQAGCPKRAAPKRVAPPLGPASDAAATMAEHRRALDTLARPSDRSRRRTTRAVGAAGAPGRKGGAPAPPRWV